MPPGSTKVRKAIASKKEKFPPLSEPWPWFHKKEEFILGTEAEQKAEEREVAKFFKTGKAPVDPVETIELFAFMEAADESKRRGGVPVSVAEVLEKAGWKAN